MAYFDFSLFCFFIFLAHCTIETMSQAAIGPNNNQDKIRSGLKPKLTITKTLIKTKEVTTIPKIIASEIRVGFGLFFIEC